MWKKKKDSYIFVAPSKRKGKKYDVYDKLGYYITSFGSIGYQHYNDRIGYYKSMNHNDRERRKRYYDRHGKTNDRTSAKFFSNTYLW